MIQQCTGSFNTHTKEEMWAGVAQSIQRLGYRLDNQDLIPGWCREEMFSLCHCIQTEFWDPLILLFNGYQGSFLSEKVAYANIMINNIIQQNFQPSDNGILKT